MELDYRNGKVKIDGKSYQLDEMRRYLMLNHENLVNKNFIKAIQTDLGTLFTYDWEYILFQASQQPDLIEDFKLFVND